LDDCHAQKTPEPAFEVHGQTFRAIFTPGKVAKKTQMDATLNNRQKNALNFIQQHGKIQAGKYRKIVGIGQRQAVKDLNQMVKQKIIIRTGAGRSTTYVLAKAEVHD